MKTLSMYEIEQMYSPGIGRHWFDADPRPPSLARGGGMTYLERVEQLEAEGLDRSDAQGVADVEAMNGRRFDFDPRYPLDPH